MRTVERSPPRTDSTERRTLLRKVAASFQIRDTPAKLAVPHIARCKTALQISHDPEWADITGGLTKTFLPLGAKLDVELIKDRALLESALTKTYQKQDLVVIDFCFGYESQIQRAIMKIKAANQNATIIVLSSFSQDRLSDCKIPGVFLVSKQDFSDMSKRTTQLGTSVTICSELDEVVIAYKPLER